MLISCWVNDTTLSPSPPAAEKEGILVCRQVVAVAVVVDVIAVVNAAIVVVDFLTGSRANRAGHKNRRKAQCDGDPDNDPQDAAQQCIQEGNKRRQLGCENIYRKYPFAVSPSSSGNVSVVLVAVVVGLFALDCSE